MTTSQRLKASIITALDETKPDESISVVDAKQRAQFSLPALVVDIASVEPHSEALQHVERIVVAAVLRVHSGDVDEADIDGWIDRIETTLTDVSAMKAATSKHVVVYSWTYGGSSQEWDESIIEIMFGVEVLCSRFEPQEQG